MLTTYDFIEQNKRRTWLLVLLFPITFALLAYVCLLGCSYMVNSPADSSSSYQRQNVYSTADSLQTYGGAEASQSDGSAHPYISYANRLALMILPWMWLGAVLWIIVAYYSGDHMLLNGAGAIEVHKEEQPEIYRLVENLCIGAGLPTPKIYIINDSSLNAFATGRDPQHASVALTKGIVMKLNRAELEGVIAHELSHIKNRDIRLMLITVAGISFFTFLSELCFRAALSVGSSRGKDKGAAIVLFFALGVFFAIYGFFIAPLIRLAISRTREYQADASAALLTRNPAALANALQKISDDPHVETLEEHASMAAMCIENPLKKRGIFAVIAGLFSTHPPIEKRIAALRMMDGTL